MSQPIVVCLGRYGDICNALPLAYGLSQETGGKIKFCVSIEFWSILEGCSYVQAIVWPFDYKDLPRAIERVKGHDAYVMQAYKHPDHSRQTESYQKEAWRIAGKLDKFGAYPLVFDARNPAREKEVDLKAALLTNPYSVNRATILVAGQSVSSPYSVDLVGMMRKSFPGYNIVDLSTLRAPRPYDLLGLMDNAACLVAVDTMHLHLARASKVPIVALINEGWFGSVPQGNVKSTIRYSEAKAEPQKIIDAVSACLK